VGALVMMASGANWYSSFTSLATDHTDGGDFFGKTEVGVDFIARRGKK
jgi:hypothetical protein